MYLSFSFPSDFHGYFILAANKLAASRNMDMTTVEAPELVHFPLLPIVNPDLQTQYPLPHSELASKPEQVVEPGSQTFVVQAGAAAV